MALCFGAKLLLRTYFMTSCTPLTSAAQQQHLSPFSIVTLTAPTVRVAAFLLLNFITCIRLMSSALLNEGERNILITHKITRSTSFDFIYKVLWKEVSTNH